MLSVIALGLLLGQDRQDPILALEKEMENREWIVPSTTLPDSLIGAARFLFAHGLADPTGGKLSRAKVATYSSSQGTRHESEVAGWVLPGVKGSRQLIVDMNGLLYETLEVGEPVTIAELQQGKAAPPMLGFSRWGGGNDPRNGLVAIALLLRSGDRDGAERIYKDVYEGKGMSESARMIEQYAVRRFHRGIGAHMYGDDRLSFRDATALAQHRDALQEAYFHDPPKGLVVTRERALDYLNVVPELRSDAQHSVFVRRKRLDLESLESVDVQRRVEILIYHLNDATGRQWSQPGSVDISRDQIFRALVEIGEPAVELLLDAYDSDTRLTRSVGYGRDFFPGRNILTVKDVAYAALETILKHPTIGSGRNRPTALELRSYWRMFKDVPLLERKYAELADEIASPRQWLAAAQYIVERENVQRSASWTSISPAKEGRIPAMKGEPLRVKLNPSVASIMARRVTQIGFPTDYRSSSDFFELDNAVKMAMYLFEWDPVGSVESLQHLSQRFKEAVIDQYGRPRPSDFRKHSIYSRVASLSFLTVGRLRLGDQTAARDYADVVSILGYEPGFNRVETRFAPMFLFPNEMELASLAESLFGTTDSPWHPSKLRFALARTEFSTRLMGVKPFRRETVALLSDESVIGTVLFDGSSYKYELGNFGSGGVGILQEEIDAVGIRKTEQQPLRVRDSVAYAIAQFKGAPLYSPVWDDDRKSQAIREIVRFVSENENELVNLIPERPGPPRITWLTNKLIEK